MARTLRKRIASSPVRDEKGTPNPPMAAPIMFVITRPAEKNLKVLFSAKPARRWGWGLLPELLESGSLLLVGSELFVCGHRCA